MKEKKNTHVNIPVFIPHLGCPNMCVFCNQRTISGVCSFIPENARSIIEEVLSNIQESGKTAEIAFFGGSFTGIDRGLMISLLDLAEEYVRKNEVCGIRMSTRPDYIDKEIISILKNYTVSAVELGIQSFSEKVLSKTKRGHSSDDSEKAIKMLTENGFSVVGQMMIGLPESTPEDEVSCAEKICALGASAARIYPTIVFRDTELYEMTLRGEYRSLSVEEAVERSADVLEVFEKNNVKCIRIGLCDAENLHSCSTYFTGPNHPSLGELVYGELYYRTLIKALEANKPQSDSVTFCVPRGDISMAIGNKSKNKKRILDKYGLKKIKFVEKDGLMRYNVYNMQ